MIRLLDFSISIFGLIFLSPILMIIYLLGFFDSSSPLFKQERVGLNQKIFLLNFPKLGLHLLLEEQQNNIYNYGKTFKKTYKRSIIYLT